MTSTSYVSPYDHDIFTLVVQSTHDANGPEQAKLELSIGRFIGIGARIDHLVKALLKVFGSDTDGTFNDSIVRMAMAFPPTWEDGQLLTDRLHSIRRIRNSLAHEPIALVTPDEAASHVAKWRALQSQGVVLIDQAAITAALREAHVVLVALMTIYWDATEHSRPANTYGTVDLASAIAQYDQPTFFPWITEPWYSQLVEDMFTGEFSPDATARTDTWKYPSND